MEWHFGHNCVHLLPVIQKCRTFVDRYNKRHDLLKRRWLSARDLLLYLRLPKQELLSQIATGEIKINAQTQKVTFGVLASWEYDDCNLLTTGGQCLYFEKHTGTTISCIADLETLDVEHPNMCLIPSDSEAKAFEVEALRVISERSAVAVGTTRVSDARRGS